MHAYAVLGLLLLSACGSTDMIRGPELPQRVVAEIPAQPPASDLHFSAQIEDASMWSALAARPDNSVFARTEIVKFIIDLEDSRALYLLNTQRWDIHYDFANAFLRTEGRQVVEHGTFNIREYRSPDRRFVLGSIVHYLDSDTWTFEMIAGDTLEGSRVVESFLQIRAATFFGDQLKYRALSEMHERMLSSLDNVNAMPTISTEEALGGARYQPLTTGVAFGYLRVVQGDLARANTRPNDILVTAGVPDDLPVCAGLITARLQAPLAHVAVLSQNRGTPNMALLDGLGDARIGAHADQLVKLVVGSQDFTITRADEREARHHWASRRPATGFQPPADFSSGQIRSVCDLRVRDAVSVGAKAAQLGEVCGIRPPIRTPRGFVVPFHAYDRHLASLSLRSGITQMLADPQFRSDRNQRERRLSELRSIVEGAPVDPALVRQVRRRLRGDSHQRFIFRSSTNAEDLPGFNGAGLYRSVVVGPRPTLEQVEQAIRQVWASVWTLRGFEERDWYRIDHGSVAMAVLIQPFVSDIAATGVAITRNPFNRDRPAVFINVQVAAGSVTDAGDQVPEQHLVYTYTSPPEPEVISHSSMTNGALILSEAETVRFTGILHQIHARLANPDDPRADTMDVEFVINQRREFIVVQARPYPR